MYEAAGMNEDIMAKMREQRDHQRFFPPAHVHSFGLGVTLCETLLISAGEEIKTSSPGG